MFENCAWYKRGTKQSIWSVWWLYHKPWWAREKVLGMEFVWNKDDIACMDIYNSLDRWQPVKEKNCRYGYETLQVLLPDIVQRERDDPDGDKTFNYS